MTVFEYHKAGSTESQEKKALAYLFQMYSTGTAVTGVLRGLGVNSTTTSSASVLVNAGACVNQQTAGSGASLMVNDTQVTLDIFGADPVGGVPRNDVVVMDQATGSIRNIVGTPNAVPADPTVPASAVALARLRHTAGATTVKPETIDDLRTFVTVGGGASAMASGGGNIGTSVAVDALAGPFPQTFPPGRFTQVPNLTFGTTDARCTVQGTSITTSGFNLYVRNNSSSTAPAGQIVTWTATQMTPTSASG